MSLSRVFRKGRWLTGREGLLHSSTPYAWRRPNQVQRHEPSLNVIEIPAQVPDLSFKRSAGPNGLDSLLEFAPQSINFILIRKDLILSEMTRLFNRQSDKPLSIIAFFVRGK